MLEMEYSGFGVNTMPAVALAPKVAIASAGMVLAVWDRCHVLFVAELIMPLYHEAVGGILRTQAF